MIVETIAVIGAVASVFSGRSARKKEQERIQREASAQRMAAAREEFDLFEQARAEIEQQRTAIEREAQNRAAQAEASRQADLLTDNPLSIEVGTVSGQELTNRRRRFFGDEELPNE